MNQDNNQENENGGMTKDVAKNNECGEYDEIIITMATKSEQHKNTCDSVKSFKSIIIHINIP